MLNEYKERKLAEFDDKFGELDPENGVIINRSKDKKEKIYLKPIINRTDLLEFISDLIDEMVGKIPTEKVIENFNDNNEVHIIRGYNLAIKELINNLNNK